MTLRSIVIDRMDSSYIFTCLGKISTCRHSQYIYFCAALYMYGLYYYIYIIVIYNIVLSVVTVVPVVQCIYNKIIAIIEMMQL